MADTPRDQQHPQYATDRDLLNQVLADLERDPDAAMVLAEIARLRIRYDGFPGARDIQQDLDQALVKLGLTEAELFEITRAIHARSDLYAQSFSKRDDWA